MFFRSLRIIACITLLASANACRNDYSFSREAYPGALEFGTQANSNFPILDNWNHLEMLDLGKQPLGSTSRAKVLIRNTGELTTTIGKIVVLSDVSSASYQATHNCSALQPKGSPCAVELAFTPDSIGSIPAMLLVEYDNGKGARISANLPIVAIANNLAFLKFEESSIDVKNNTIGYSISAVFKVIYNGAHVSSSAYQILPAKEVMILDPTDSQFKIDRASSSTTCGTTISADCQIKVNFQPTSIGLKNANFFVSYYNGAEALKIQASVIGTGTAAVQLAQLSAPALNFEKVVYNPASPKVLPINIAFSGSVPAEDVVIAGPSSGAFTLNRDPLVSTCFASTTINGPCTLSVSFNPTAKTTYLNAITLTYNSHGQAVLPITTVAISGEGVNPALIATNTNSVAFNSVPTYKTVTSTVTLTNNGEVAVSGLSSVTSSDARFSGSFGSTCATLAAGATCNLTITFKPNAATAFSGNLNFTYFDGRATKSIQVSASGTGTTPVVMELGTNLSKVGNRSVIDFGNVMIGLATLPAAKSVQLNIYGTTKITNASQLVVTPSSLNSPFAFTGGGAFPGTGGNCITPLNPNSSNKCTFSTSLISNSLTADVAVTQDFTVAYQGDNSDGSGSLPFTMKVTPRNPPVAVFVAPLPAISTVSVGNSTQVTYTIKNNSPYFATVAVANAVTLNGDSAFSIPSGGNNCTSSLAANTSCTVKVQFKPSASGTFNGTLKFSYNNQITNQDVSVNLSAVGSAAVTLLADVTNLAFGNVYIGDTIPEKIVNLTYYGEANWTPNFTVNAPYSIDATDCGTPRSCVLKVRYNPVAASTHNATVNFDYSPGLPVPARIALTLSGVAQFRAPTLGFGGANFPNTLNGKYFDKDVTITNNGTSNASQLHFALPAGAFAYSPDGAPGTAGYCAEGQSLTSGQNCKLKIRFTPTQVGTQSAAFVVEFIDNARNMNGSANVTLSGKGTVPIQVYAGGYNTCIISELQKVVCWGRNSSGQLGLGNSNVVNALPQNSTAVNFGSAAIVPKKIAVGFNHVCALVSNASRSGMVSCWGSNADGRLGLGVAAAQVTSPLNGGGNLQIVDLGTDSRGQPLEAIDVSAGFEHTCAVLKDGAVKCWGGNTSGQLGSGASRSLGSSANDMGDNLIAVNLQGVAAIGVSAGAGHTCATLSDGGAKCWGDNFYGQLGQGVNSDRLGSAAQDMASIHNINLGSSVRAASAIASNGGAFSCIVLGTGDVKCFGKTAYGEDGSSPFYGVLGTCWARTEYNAAPTQCWKAPGLSPTLAIGYLPADIDNLPIVDLNQIAVSKFAVGAQFACFIGGDDNLRCWGVNDRGQLGNGSVNHVGSGENSMGSHLAASLAPNNGVKAIDVATGAEHACAVLSDNTVKCWGAYTDNATGLMAAGNSSDTGMNPNTPRNLSAVYDGR